MIPRYRIGSGRTHDDRGTMPRRLSVSTERRPPTPRSSGSLPKWRLFQYLFVAALVVVAATQLKAGVGNVSDLAPFRRVLNYPWLAAALLLQMLQYVSDGYFTKRLLRILEFEVSLLDTIRIAALDVFGATLLPFGQLGSMAAAFYFYRQRGLPSEAIVFLNLALAVITAAVLGVLFIVALAALPAHTFALHWPIAALIITCLLLCGAAIVFFVLVRVGGPQSWIVALLPRCSWCRRIQTAVTDCWQYAGSMHAKRSFVATVTAKDVAYYGIDILSIEGCFLALHTAPHLALVATAYVISLVCGYVAMTPAGLGATDATLTVLLLGGGLSPSPILGMLLLYRLINVVLPAPFGAWCFYTLRRESASAGASSG
jgi:uncharacterized protein (TIRG00374 family)